MKLFSLTLGIFLSVSALHASNFSFQGNFATDDQLQLFTFTVNSVSTVTIQSFSYGGGTNFAGNTILPGGFDPQFTLFDSTGTQMNISQDDSNNGCIHSLFFAGSCLDDYYSNSFAIGTYTLVLAEWGNNSNGDLIDGFTPQSTAALIDGHWALDIRTVDSASMAGTPEPASLLLSATGLASLLCATRRRYQRN